MIELIFLLFRASVRNSNNKIILGVIMMGLSYNKCPVCGSDNFKVIGKVNKINQVFKKESNIDQVKVVKCKICSLTYLYPQINYTEELYSKMYNIDYFSNDNSLLTLKNMAEKRRLINKITNLIGDTKGKKLLDIGCGTGEYLLAADEKGFDVTGIDIDKSITNFVSNKYNFNMINSLLYEETFEESTFDVVVLSHVAEHLENPNKMIAIIHKILKPDGFFLMLSPNVNSFVDDLMDIYNWVRYGKGLTNRLSPFITPFHVIGFNMKSVKILLENNKFKVIYAKKYHGLDWEERCKGLLKKAILKAVKFIGLLINRGVEIVTISKK